MQIIKANERVCMVLHLLVWGSLVLGSEIFYIAHIVYIFLYFYTFPAASIHDIQRAN